MEAHAGGSYTLFAPAEKASYELVRLQARAVLGCANLEKLFDSITDMVVVVNRERQIVYANQRFLETVGLNSEELVYGLRTGEAFRCAHASESEGGCGTTEFCRTCGAVKAILSAQKGYEDLQECRILQKESGDALELLVRTTPLSIENDEFTIAAIRDISHEKRRRLLERLFFHDVMNTAVGVRGLSELLNIAGAEQLDEFRRMIYSGAVQLVEEIKAQRDLTAAENNELKCNITSIDVNKMIKEIVELYRLHEAAKGRFILVSDKAESIRIQSDKALLMRVLGNMLKNALESCAEGDTVTIGCEYASDDKVKFQVHNPAYVPRDVQLQIFQRSFSTKGIGRGLGTYSMKLLSERYLGGSVRFESSEEGGTTFSAVYPITCEMDQNE